MRTNQQTQTTDRIRLGDMLASRPFADYQGRPMIAVEFDDGDAFVTYHVGHDVLNAWAEVDTFGRQLTDSDV
jgi:hypothetical protein